MLFAIGAVSGTILSFELALLWPEFMRVAGGIIGMPFSLEGFAFFTEAIFLGLYLYGGRRLSRRALFLVTIPIVVSAALSAVFVISANAWMNTPEGFTLEDGRVVEADPWRAMFNPAMPYEALHGTLASYVATGFAVASVYAWALLWTRHYPSAQVAAGATVAMTLGGFAAAMYPELILGQLSIDAAAAPRDMLVAFLAALPFGAAVLVPSLALLYWTSRGEPDYDLPAEGH